MLIKSTKAQFNVGSNSDQLKGIAGFYLTGTGRITILFRTLGPKLRDLGYGGTIADPAMRLVAGTAIDTPPYVETNDNWSPTGGTSQTNLDPTFNIPANLYELQNHADPNWRQFDPDHESPFNPGRSWLDIGPLRASDCLFWHTFTLTGTPQSYTAVVDSNTASTGIARLEMYVMASTNSASLAQVSARATIEGDNVVLSNEFEIFSGAGRCNVLQRAIGPSLSIDGILFTENPSVELYNNKNVLIAQNDDWQMARRHAEIVSLGLSPNNANESILYNTLVPGKYTAVARSVRYNGVGVNEVYVTAI